MAIIRTEKQKDNLSKFSYDMAKIIVAILVIGHIARPEAFNIYLLLYGLIISFVWVMLGFILDARETIK